MLRDDLDGLPKNQFAVQQSPRTHPPRYLLTYHRRRAASLFVTATKERNHAMKNTRKQNPAPQPQNPHVPPALAPVQTHLNEILLHGKVHRLPGGEFHVVPARPATEFSVRQAAHMLGVSTMSIHRLCVEGILEFRRPTPRRTLIDGESLRLHRLRCVGGECWQGQARWPGKGRSRPNRKSGRGG